MAVRLHIDDACTACGLCIVTCPEHVLSPARHRPSILQSKCTFCYACIEVCPTDAISEQPVR